MADVIDNNTSPSAQGLNGEQPLQSLKDALPDALPDAQAPQTDSVPPSPRPASGNKSPLAELFRAFAKFGDSKADGKAISLSQSDKW